MINKVKKKHTAEQSHFEFYNFPCLHGIYKRFFMLGLLVLNIAFFPSSIVYAMEDGVMIKEIEVSGLNRISREELIYLLDLKAGQPLEKKKISAGLRRVFKKGVFLDIQVIAEPVKEGVRLKFVVKEVPVVNKVSFEGIENIPKKDIKKEFLFKKGDDFREELLEQARLQLTRYYLTRGYPDVVLKIFSSAADSRDKVNLRIVINQGRPLIINNVTLPPDAEIFIKMIRGDVFDKEKLESDMKKLREHYKKGNYINPVIGPYRFVDGHLDIPVEIGPRLHVAFKNNKVFSSKKLKKEVPFLENEEVTDESVSETVNRIRKLYLGKGYYYAQVAAGIERGEHLVKVTFMIFEGEKVLLSKVHINGEQVDQETVMKIIPFKEGNPYNDNLLESVKDDLARFYRALGYLQFEIKDVKKQFSADGRQVSIELNIYEGPQTRIDTIVIKGNKKLSQSRIMRSIHIQEGDAYNTVDIGDARYGVLSLYRSKGYVDAHVETKSVVEGNKASVIFMITENRPSVIGKMIIRGNKKTKTSVIEREFTVREGDSYNQQEITRIRQRLYKLGIFSEVTINMLDRDDDNKIVRDVLVSLKEGKAGTVEIGLGYSDYEELRGSFDISYRNIGGLNRQIGFRTELSFVEERYVLNFVEPWFFNMRNLPLKMFLMKENTRSINVETRDLLYRIDKFSFIAGFEKELINGLRVGLNYEYSFTDTSDVQPGIILSKEDTGTLGIGSISPSIFYDNRDNPFDPRSGSLHGIVMKFASQVFLSETEFVKASLQSSWYFPLRKDTVFAFSIKGGAAYSFEGKNEVPLIERYFLGGRSTVRGYSNDALGPKGEDGNPTGGNVFALLNGEFRFSIWRGLGIVAFLDSGNVWKTAENIETSLRHTVGGGLRYSTPVGPIRVDYGYKLSRESDESAGEVHFSFGHAF
jgi:outer membrane protein insertion porin family